MYFLMGFLCGFLFIVAVSLNKIACDLHEIAKELKENNKND